MHRRGITSVALTALILVLLSFALVSTALSQNSDGRFRARLNGFNETPSISTVAHGDFAARLVNSSTLEFTLRYSALEGGSAAQAHIHLGQRHVAGGVSAWLCGGGGQAACPAGASATINGTVTAANVTGPANQGIAVGEFNELVRAMRAGATYVNVHTPTFGSGEIRGQVRSGDDRGDDRED
jgi:CHRD domain